MAIVSRQRLIFGVFLILLIVALGEALPLIFNSYAFMFLTVSALVVRTPEPDPYIWMVVEVIGGGLLLLGVVGITRIMVVAHRK